MDLIKKQIINSYSYCKKKASKNFEHQNFEQSLNYIWMASQIANNFNWIYSDLELEKLLKSISDSLLNSTISYEWTDNKRLVLYDSFSWDNKGLTQQYLRAFMSYDINFLYITESSSSNKNSKTIFEELKAYDKAEIFEVPQNIERTKQIKIIYDKIISYKPSRLFMHLSPSAVSPITAFYALPQQITIYQINLTNHAFWLGSSCLDYSLEFCPRGCTLSKEKRGLNKQQLLLQPMHPIMSKSTFEGFPIETTDKVVIFSGGAFYKVSGGDGEYFSLVKQILNENQNVVFLFAGNGDSHIIDDFIKKNKFERRFILLGHRSDINEVFSHIDIYMGTYPTGGGLMTQYAAMHGKPILNYKTKHEGLEVEEIVCQNINCKITFIDKKLFFIEAKRLINDVEYRDLKGVEVKACLYTPEQFNETLFNTITTNQNQKKYQNVRIEYDNIFDQYVKNKNTIQNHKSFLIKNFKLQTLILFPRIFIWFIFFIFSKRGFQKVQNRLKVKMYRNK